MPRRQSRPTDPEIARRLAAIKLMIAGMADAMPTMAKELRREARESLDELIGELA